MFVKPKLLFLIFPLVVLLCFCTFLSAEDNFFHLNEKWSLELSATISAIKLYDINANNSQEIVIATNHLLKIASDSARDIIATSPELPFDYGISCIEAGDLDQNVIPEILVGASLISSGHAYIFSDAQLDSYITVPEGLFCGVVSLKIVNYEDSSVTFLGCSEVWMWNIVGSIWRGTGFLDDMMMFLNVISVPGKIDFLDIDEDGSSELIIGAFFTLELTSVHFTSSDILIRVELPDTVMQYKSPLFSFSNTYGPVYEPSFASLKVGNCDADPQLEVLGSAYVDTGWQRSLVVVLSAVDGSSKSEQWRKTYSDDSNIVSGIALVDYNHDGINEVLVAHKNAPMELLNGEDGSKIAESDSTYKVDHFAFGDVDGDGEGEIVIADGNILRVLEPDFSTDVPEEEDDLVFGRFITLEQNYPNPFNSSTTIPFTLKRPIYATLAVYNILGQKVRTLLNEEKFSGNHRVIWDGKNDEGKTVPSGIYFYKLASGKYSESKKMLFLK